MAKSEAQAKRDIIDLKFIDYNIEYPFCYKTKDEKNFFRYLEDGRFERIWIDDNKSSGIQFGNYANRIEQLNGEKEFFFKVISNRFIVIDNNEFEVMRNYNHSQYSKYLEGELYLSYEVQNILKLREAVLKKEEQKNDGSTGSPHGIITNNNEQDPF